MAQWTYRSKTDPTQGGTLEGADLRKMLEAEIVGDDHEFRPPDSEEWLSAFKALKLLMSAPPAKGEAEKGEAAAPPRSPIDSETSQAPKADDRPQQPPIQRPRQCDPKSGPPPKSQQRPTKTQTNQATASTVSQMKPPPRRDTLGASPPSLFPKNELPGLSEVRQGSTRRRRPMDKESDEDLDITSMIDMTFLLLTFFMVTSTMDPVSSAELPPSKTGRMVETKDRLEIMLQLPDDLDWDPESPGAAPVSIEQVKIFLADKPEDFLSPAELGEQLRDGFQEMDQPKAVLYAHKRMPSGVVNEVLRIAREAGASEISVGVTVPK